MAEYQTIGARGVSGARSAQIDEGLRAHMNKVYALMSGALLGSLPVVILYSFFVDYYVSSMTGAVKE